MKKHNGLTCPAVEKYVVKGIVICVFYTQSKKSNIEAIKLEGHLVIILTD